MVKLKLNGPRRRESGRIKKHTESQSPTEETCLANEASKKPSTARRRSSKPSVKTTSLSTKSGRNSNSVPALPGTPEDTIRVKSKTASIEISDDTDDSPLSDLEALEDKVEAHRLNDTGTNRPWARSGKAAVGATSEPKDLAMPDADDAVEEYDFSKEPEIEDEEDNGEDTIAYKTSTDISHTIPLKQSDEVITISSDDDKEESTGWELDDRPWKQFSAEERREWEQMYCELMDSPLNRDWRNTEDYQEQRDLEMARYLEDFPLDRWVIPRQRVQDGYNRLMDRIKWRSLGIPIYGRQPIPGVSSLQQSWQFGSMQEDRSMNDPSSRRPSQVPQVPQQQMAQPVQPARVPHRMSQGVRPGMQQHLPQLVIPPNVPRPPPTQVLPSQPNAQPVPTHPNGTPIYQSRTAPTALPSSVLPQAHVYSKAPQQEIKSDKGKSKETDISSPLQGSSLPPGLIPPYEMREKPVERKSVTKHGRRNARRPGELEVFPWNRNIDFEEARLNATWDDSIYDPGLLEDMAAARARNEVKLERIDAEENERQRAARKASQARKKGAQGDAASDTEKTRTYKKRASSPKPGGTETAGSGGGGGDLNHTGHFCFATPEDQQKALALNFKTPDDVLYAADENRISDDLCAQIIICWNPGKKHGNGDLELVRFSVKDTMATRAQLARSPILTRRAAECIVDFCPDLLYQKRLLQIIAESDLGNKDVRDRMSFNGNAVDKATVTKRIGSALGQKQQQSMGKMKHRQPKPPGDPADAKIKGYAKDEADYFNVNIEDYSAYMDYFGKRTSHRAQLVLGHGGGQKRNVIDFDEDGDGSSGTEMKPRGTTKRLRGMQGTGLSSEPNIAPSSDAMEVSGEEADSSDPASADTSGDESVDSKADAVSIQSDTILDAMDED